MRKIAGAAADITRKDKITPKERDAIEAMSREHPTIAGDAMIAAKFGRSPKTIIKMRMAWQKAEGIKSVRHKLTPINEPFREVAALDFAKKYRKPFSIKTAAEYMGPYSGYAGMFRRLQRKGYFTTQIVKMHRRRKDGVTQRVKTLIFIPTAQLLEE